MWSTDRGIGAYDISSDPARLDLDAIHAYLSRSYWSPGIPRELVERGVRNSLCFGAYQRTGGQVGFARVVTDHATFAYLCDVYVLEEHRGRGLAKALMRAIVGHPAFSGARRVMLATRDAHGLYRRFGFDDVTRNTTLMEIVRPNLYAAGSGSR
jgi:ribosomal protein S18 acetylase RimI-like enzyme